MDIWLTILGLAFWVLVTIALGNAYLIGVKEKRRRLLENYESDLRMYLLDVKNEEDDEHLKDRYKRLSERERKIENPSLRDKYWPI